MHLRKKKIRGFYGNNSIYDIPNDSIKVDLKKVVTLTTKKL